MCLRTASFCLPEAERAASTPLLGISPGGVCRAFCLAAEAVSSYLAFSPLLPEKTAVCFLWHFPYSAHYRRNTGRYPAPCPSEFGLSSMCKEHIATAGLLLIILYNKVKCLSIRSGNYFFYKRNVIIDSVF